MSTEMELKRLVELANEGGFVKTNYFMRSPVYHMETQATRLIRIKKDPTQPEAKNITFLLTAGGGGSPLSNGSCILTLKTYASAGVHSCVGSISNLLKDWRIYIDSDTNYWYVLALGGLDYAHLTMYFLNGNKQLVEILSTTYTYPTSSDKLVAPPYVYSTLSGANSWTTISGKGNAYKVEGRMVHVNFALTGGTITDATTIMTVPSPYRIQTQSPPYEVATYKDSSGNYQPCLVYTDNGGNIKILGVKNNTELIGKISFMYGV